MLFTLAHWQNNSTLWGSHLTAGEEWGRMCEREVGWSLRQGGREACLQFVRPERKVRAP